MTDIALVTYQRVPPLSDSDQRLIEPLVQRGVQPYAISWDDASVDWQRFAAVILRSCWDYHKRPDEFRRWVEQIRDIGVPLYNSPQTVLWNMEKGYLQDLTERGIRTIPTLWIMKHEKPNLRDLLDSNGWDKAVLKPTIGASAYGIQTLYRVDAEHHQSDFETLLETSNLMVQPRMEEIRAGELSLVFFDHVFSYAIRKTPGAGTIFVNSAYGGSRQVIQVSDKIIEAAQFALDTSLKLTSSQSHLYARVDGILVNGEFTLMELELIEPGLLLDIAPVQGTQDFVRAIVKRLP